MISPSSRPLPTLLSSRKGLALIVIVLVGLVAAILAISPPGDDIKESRHTQSSLPVPLLNSTEAVAAWHGNPLDPDPVENTDDLDQLTQQWNTFRGKFSPLPGFDELPATFRIRTLAAGHDPSTGFTIAMHSEWDAETIAEKLRPFRNRLTTLAAHRVDIDRLESGVLVETHELRPTGKIHILRHASWVIATNMDANIPTLAKAAIEQTPNEKKELTPATYSALNTILKTLNSSAEKSVEQE